MGTLVFISAYVIANFVLFVVVLDQWEILNNSFSNAAIDRNSANGPLSGYAPFAKAFGNLLDFNCAIILVPVARTVLRM